MGRISAWRVLFGGALAGLVLFFGQGFIHMNLLKEFGEGLIKDKLMIGPDEARALGALPMMLGVSILTGFLLAWFYAAVRPRLGAGLMTAIVTGLAGWALLFLQADLPMAVWHPRFRPAIVVVALGNVILFTLAAALAGWVYSEPGDAGARNRR